jgi:hypothetical protein
MNKLDRLRAAGSLFTLVAFVLILTGPAPVSAQNRKPIPSPPPKPPTSETSAPSAPPPNLRTADQATMEMQVLMARRWTVADAQREQRRANAQLSMDLERLSQLEAQNIAPVSSARSIDYRTLAQAAGEIKDRASRIKFSLPIVLKDRGEKVRREADPGKLGLMLPDLSRAIKNFIGNPVLRVNSPNDAELRSTAGHDLESIIKLSDTINKIAKRLSKSDAATK